MDLKLQAFDFDQAVARAGLRRDGTPLPRLGGVAGAGAPAVQGASFANAMSQALTQVSEAGCLAKCLRRIRHVALCHGSSCPC